MSLSDVIKRFCITCISAAKTSDTPEAAPLLGVAAVSLVSPKTSEADAETENAPACTAEWFRAQGVDPLREDLPFIERHLPWEPELRAAVLLGYVDAWRAAADAEPASHRKQNAGIRAANTALREGTL